MDHAPYPQKWQGKRIERLFYHLVDAAYRRWPRPEPPSSRLHACRIISHRGEHDNRSCFENTLPAFDAAVAAGIWGLEMDIRWTRDLVPVVFHDPDTGRLFGDNVRLSRMDLETLKNRFPRIPTLAEVVGRYGGRRHLMIEIKAEPYPQPLVQARRMAVHLGGLSPGKEFHLMGLDPQMFAYFDFLPPAAMIPIARMRIGPYSRLAARRQWGGLAGHYLLATTHLLARHHRLGQAVGTGFVDHRRCLFREVSRGVDWIFSNRAARMQAVCNGCQS